MLDCEFFFQDKNILDIGCGDGTLSIQISKKYNPKKIKGIDIDHKLITQAQKNKNILKGNNNINYESDLKINDYKDNIETKKLQEKIKKFPKYLLNS